MESQIVLILDAMYSFMRAYQDKGLWNYEWVLSDETYKLILKELKKNPFDKTVDYECTWRTAFMYAERESMRKHPQYIAPRIPTRELLFGLPVRIRNTLSTELVRLQIRPLIEPCVTYK